MKKAILFLKNLYLSKLLLFWMLLFFFYRLAFIAYHLPRIPEEKQQETLLSLFYALRLDFSTACFAATIPFLLWATYQFTNYRFVERLNRLINALLVTIVTVFSVGNIKIYEEWGTPLNARAAYYLRYPQEIVSFMTNTEVAVVVALLAALSYIGIKRLNGLANNFSSPISPKPMKVYLSILIPLLLVIGYRGGLQLAPINESSAYYSTTLINNHIATNNMWYLAHSIADANDRKNPYEFMPLEEAKKITQELLSFSSDKTLTIASTEKPNVIFIVLESWTADIIEKLGGEKGVTPNFNNLTDESLLLTQMYSSGYRTEQGLVSIFSGFPSQPNNSIITTPSKAEQLASLPLNLKKQGYSLSFYYGGEIEFANMKSYLLNSGFDYIVDKENFDSRELNSKWGAHDEFVFSKQLNELKNAKEPFLSTILTLSTHEPFEVTINTPFNGKEKNEEFKKAAYYTDYCLGEYFKRAKEQAWYNNTLFVLLADHGHRLPKNRNLNYPESRRITALITGGALKDSLRGKTFDGICNQHDITGTMAEQLHIRSTDFYWSKNIFNPNTQQFAYYSNENTLGWITPEATVIYSLNTNDTIAIQQKKENKSDTTLTNMKAYLQTLYDQYLNY